MSRRQQLAIKLLANDVKEDAVLPPVSHVAGSKQMTATKARSDMLMERCSVRVSRRVVPARRQHLRPSLSGEFSCDGKTLLSHSHRGMKVVPQEDEMSRRWKFAAWQLQQ